MSNPDTNYSRQQTVGGSRIAGNLAGGAGATIGVYKINNPFGGKRSDFIINSITADGAATVWLTSSLTDLMTAGQAATPTDLPNPSSMQVCVLGAAGTIPYHGLAINTAADMYLAVVAAADNIHAWVSFMWEMEAVRLDFYNAVFKTQEAAAHIMRAAEEVSKQTTWLEKLRQIPAPWNLPSQGPASNKPTRAPAPQLFQAKQAEQLTGVPDIPRNKPSRLTRG